MSLLQNARIFDPGRPRQIEVTDEELELYIAFMNGEVTRWQCIQALERSSSFFHGWATRCAQQLYRDGKTMFDIGGSKTLWKPKSYAESLEQHKKYTTNKA